jgi:hypothetical protein
MNKNQLLKTTLAVIPIILLASGCASISNTAKALMGTSTRALEDAKEKQGQPQVFKIGYPDAYRRVFELLKKKNITTFLHSQKKRRIVAMHFLGVSDTTEVGIFFTEIAPQETKITVTSLSPGHLKLATTIILLGLEKDVPTITKKEEGNENP